MDALRGRRGGIMPRVKADELKQWMTEHGYSVRRLAASLAISPGMVQHYRSGAWPIPRAIELALLGLMAEESGGAVPQ